MKTTQTFEIEDRSPFLWQKEKPPLFVGSAGHIKEKKGLIGNPIRAYYLGVIFCVSGRISITMDVVPHMVEKDKVCLILPGTRYHLDVVSDTAEFLYFSIDGIDSKHLINDYSLWEGCFNCDSPFVEEIMKIMSKLSDTSAAATRVNLVTALDILLTVQDRHRIKASDPLCLEAEIFIRKNWQDPLLDLTLLFDTLGVPKSSLGPRFKKQVGKTLLNYLHDLRLAHATKLINETGMPISKIAHQCGFSDSSYFSKFLKKKTGLSPQELKKKSPDEHLIFPKV